MSSAPPGASPAEAGFAMPAEWETHEATWLAWPHNRYDWPGKLNPVQWTFAEMVRKLAPGEMVHVLVNDARWEQRAVSMLRRVGASVEHVRFFRIPTNRSWTRDYGPVFVRDALGDPAVVDFRFNAWAKYPNWHKDDRVAAEVARRLGLPLLPAEAQGRPFVLEGGAIDVNGEGMLLTTEECLLHPSRQQRNPELDREQVTEALQRLLGAQQVGWLGRG
ncbi:MAG: agmatine deiminase family protein, partial [Planctomycetota bacterium]